MKIKFFISTAILLLLSFPAFSSQNPDEPLQKGEAISTIRKDLYLPPVEKSVSFDSRLLSFNFAIDYNMLFCTNTKIREDVKVVPGKFANYIGFRAGVSISIAKTQWQLIDIGIIEKLAFNKKNALALTAYFQSNLDWFCINADIKYMHKFNENFSLNIGLRSPVSYIKPYPGGKVDIDDIILFLLSFYDVFTVGFNIYI